MFWGKPILDGNDHTSELASPAVESWIVVKRRSEHISAAVDPVDTWSSNRVVRLKVQTNSDVGISQLPRDDLIPVYHTLYPGLAR
jgi:hypothetical protein